MTYHHLTYSERQRIGQLHSAGYSQAAIARRLDVHRSTIKKELDRNSIQGEYDAAHAERLTRDRKQKRGSYKQKKNLRYLRSFRLVRRTIAFNEPQYRLFHTFGTDPREREKRIQKDYRKKEGFRFRNEPDPDYQIFHAWILQHRKRNHLIESILRTKRSQWDFMRYNRIPSWQWGITYLRNITLYRRNKKRVFLERTLRGRYRKHLYSTSYQELKAYTPYRFTRFDWLFRPPNPAGKTTVSRFSSQEATSGPSKRSLNTKREYSKQPLSLKPLHSRPSTRKTTGRLCPEPGKKLPPPVLKRKRGAKKHPPDCKPPSAAYFFA